MENKLNYIVEQIGGINKTLEFQAKQLQEHIKRTEILESRVIPIEDHVKFIRNLMKLTLWMSSLSGLIMLIIKLWKKA